MLNKHGISVNIENVLIKLVSKLQTFREKFKITQSEVFKVTPKVMMNLLLTFESYDEQVTNKDMFMPEEKLINFNIGYLKLKFKGLLRITMDRGVKIPLKEGEPKLSYGVVEKQNLFLSIDKPVMVKHLFIRANGNSFKDTSSKAIEITITGMKNDVKIWESRKIMNKEGREWVIYLNYNFVLLDQNYSFAISC